MRAILLFMLLCASTLYVDAQLHSKGTCPETPYMKNLNISGMYGKWYLQEYYYNYYGEGKCQRNYISGNGSEIFNYKTEVFDLIKGEPVTNEIVFTFTNPNSDAIFKRVSPPGGGTRYILDTDYTSYYIYFGCRDFKLYHARVAHLYTREQYPKQEVLDKLHEVMENKGQSTEHLIPEDQSCEP